MPNNLSCPEVKLAGELLSHGRRDIVHGVEIAHAFTEDPLSDLVRSIRGNAMRGTPLLKPGTGQIG